MGKASSKLGTWAPLASPTLLPIPLSTIFPTVGSLPHCAEVSSDMVMGRISQVPHGQLLGLWEDHRQGALNSGVCVPISACLCVCRGYTGKYVSLCCVSEGLKVHSCEHKPTLCVCVCVSNKVRGSRTFLSACTQPGAYPQCLGGTSSLNEGMVSYFVKWVATSLSWGCLSEICKAFT